MYDECTLELANVFLHSLSCVVCLSVCVCVCFATTQATYCLSSMHMCVVVGVAACGRESLGVI